MKFEELDNVVLNSLSESSIQGYNSIQEQLIHKLKQGRNCFISLDHHLGVRTSLQFCSLIKAPQAFEGSPRVLWITARPERAQMIVKELQDWTRRSEIAVEFADDKGKMIVQRNHIFEGADIIVGNPKRIMDLYNQNGIHVNQLTFLIIDDASEMCKNPVTLQQVKRVNESLPKCMKWVVTYGDHARLADFTDEICGFYDIIE
jgi:superfamily II DNA/RNA helicase